MRAAEAVVAAALAAFHAQEWEVVTALTDADSMENLRRHYLDEKAGRFALPPRESWEPVDSFLEELDELLATMPEQPVTFHELAGVSTLEEAEALGVAEFMVRWAQARHDGYLAAHGVGAMGPCDDSQAPSPAYGPSLTTAGRWLLRSSAVRRRARGAAADPAHSALEAQPLQQLRPTPVRVQRVE